MKAVIYTGETPLGKEIIAELQGVSYEIVSYGKRADIPETVPDDPIDLLILVGGSKDGLPKLDREIGTERDYESLSAYLGEQMLIRYELIKKYIPALEKGRGKRIGFVSYRYASVSDNQDVADYALHMDAVGMSMQAKMVHEKYRNQINGSDFTVRYFAAELSEMERKKGLSAAQYIQMNFCHDKRYFSKHYEENHLRIRDHKFVQIPW